MIVFSLIGGSVADAFNRRKIMFITQGTMALVALALALADLERRDQPLAHLPADRPAGSRRCVRPARPAGVGPKPGAARDLPNAFSMQSIASQTGAIVGPAGRLW